MHFFILHPSAAQCCSFSYYTRRAIIAFICSCILVQASSSVKPQIPSGANVHAVFQRPYNFAHTDTCLMCPCRAFDDFLFCFSRQIFGFLYFLGYLGLKGPHIFAEKKKK